MNLWSVEHFLAIFFHHFWVGATAKQQQTYPKVMTKMVKKCLTDQRFIRKRNTTYKIHTLIIWVILVVIKPVNFSLTREKAIAAYRKEKEKKRDKVESKREKFRDGIAQKYGIKRKTGENVSKIDDKSLQVSRKIIVMYKVDCMWSRL